MTEQEKIIVSAYTGYLLCDFEKVHEYIEKKLNRPIWTHEYADETVYKEIREKCRDDFVALAEDAFENTGKWEFNEEQSEYTIEKIYTCSACKNYSAWGENERIEWKYCPNCGAKMKKQKEN